MNLTDLFITDADFYEVAPVSKNTDVTASILQMILQAQENYILPVICDDMYDELQEQINTSTVTADNQALLSYIKPALAWFTLYELYPFMWAKSREMGVVKQKNDSVEAVALPDVTYLRGQAFKNAQKGIERLTKYICKNRELYPLITVISCGCCGTLCVSCSDCNSCGCKGKLSNPFFMY